MPTLLELIEAERWKVQDLRTRLTSAKALQDELDQRTRGRGFTYANSTVQQMIGDHRHALVMRTAGWIRSAGGGGGILDQIGEWHLPELRSLGAGPFGIRFPHVAAGSIPGRADLEHVRDKLQHDARSLLENSDAIRSALEVPGSPSTNLATLEEIGAVIEAAEDLLNDLAVCAGGSSFQFSKHLALPQPEAVARDLVDLVVIGTVDDLLAATGAEDRLGMSGTGWWQLRREFWGALDEEAAKTPGELINAPALVAAALSRVIKRSLTTPQIERIVDRYRLEYARYDTAARSVEDKLRRLLLRERVKALISSRTKDPDSLRGKLVRKGSKYEFAKMDAELGSVVTDLAGVRVILYDDEQTELVAQLIKDAWQGCTDEPHTDKYKARHFTVTIAEPETRAIDGAACEIQLTSLAWHAFNELEHDITYKDQDVAAGQGVREMLEAFHLDTAALQLKIRSLLAARRSELAAGKTVIEKGMDLGTVLDGVFRRRVAGDFDALLYLWQGAEREPLTRRLVEQRAPSLHEMGRRLAPDRADDATIIAFALFDGSLAEMQDMARDYSDQASVSIRAILSKSALEHL
jgi:ppGpp synthetase/RelA/SpoT-type nucleotidyltranferase